MLTGKKLTKYSTVLVLLAICLLISSCRKEEDKVKVTFYFQHKVKGADLVKDNLIYTNTAGNQYQVDELQYFISDIVLWSDGIPEPFTVENGIHYVDIDIPSTLTWSPDQKIRACIYDSVSFVFGIDSVKNKTGLFLNPPERDMFWPEMMGGGYHYMKMNGKWINASNIKEAFNFHLGIGMTEDQQGNMQFVHNYFAVTLPLKNCSISISAVNPGFILKMDINSWFDTPYIWDWNVTGGHIMQNQEAMHKGASNGRDAFSIEYTGFLPE